MDDLLTRLEAAISRSRDTNGDLMYFGPPDALLVDALAEIRSLRARLDAAGWRPIYSAPRDGTSVDLWAICHLKWNKAGERIVNRKWGPCIDWRGFEHDGWGLSEDFEPTHWMPVPAQPIEARSGETACGLDLKDESGVLKGCAQVPSQAIRDGEKN